jgi:hypothetical protein
MKERRNHYRLVDGEIDNVIVSFLLRVRSIRSQAMASYCATEPNGSVEEARSLANDDLVDVVDVFSAFDSEI